MYHFDNEILIYTSTKTIIETSDFNKAKPLLHNIPFTKSYII